MEVLGCQAWDVGVTLTTDEEVHELNARVIFFLLSVLHFGGNVRTISGLLPVGTHRKMDFSI